jgi:molybdate transport system regulatory protein
MSGKNAFSATGEVRLSRDGENLLDESRMALLERIAETGSITKAGKAVGVSYRTAWLTIDHLNALSDSPLVERTTGGKSGGGTRLTPHGETLLNVYRAIQAEHRKYLERLREGIHDFDRFLQLTRKISLKTSARNQFFGIVESIRKSALTAEVVLRLKGKDRIRSQITLEGLEGLGLRKGEEAYALIKANWIAPLAARGPGKAEMENAMKGKVISMIAGGKNAEVVTQTPAGTRLVAMVPLKTAREMRLREGLDLAVAFKASNVILGIAK